MAEITPILQHFQDVLTGKVPFDQIPKSQEDDQYYEDPLECKNIHGRPQGAKNKKKIKKKRTLKILNPLNSIQEKRKTPIKSDQKKTSISQSFSLSPIMEVD
ncbi:hypothetical protein O181_004428 [Austropuccinia psidii MF-1]|uniref:Uncharacterized protein n=1 Tax=Austropuccinia psidii MF-1 TaxID=1389203 RepID=A0A9Q3BGK1_9BASI|nr:hypothetical protein [Austropuccinia psidii MF-1]